MKKILPVVLCILCIAIACKRSMVEKPAHLIEKDEMVNILYDIALLQSIRSYSPQSMEDSRVSAETYIYKKYSIDSLTFVDNHKYYAADIEKYEKMQKEVSQRLKDKKAILDSLVKKVEPKKKPQLKNRRVIDSVKNAK